MSSADMTPESLPADTSTKASPVSEPLPDPSSGGTDEGVPDRPNRKRRWWFLGGGLTLLVGAVLGTLFVPLPYVLLQPGSVRPAEPRIQVSGAKTFRSDSDVMFTTVYINRATLAGLLIGELDDAIEIRTEKEVYGDRSQDESKVINQAEMDLSKEVATLEALKYLGYQARFTGDGARIVDVAPDSGSAGILQPGDVIVAIDSQPVDGLSGLRDNLAHAKPGDTVTVGVKRPSTPSGETASGHGGAPVRIDEKVVLGAAEDDADKGVLGVVVEPVNPRVESDVKVKIDSGTVTGPSAGLAWSLGIIDRLTPGSLTDGRDVAVTGEILTDGRVGIIGGIEQKVSTVKRNGVKVFLYPAATPEDQQREMRRIAGDDVKLVPVATLADAVEYLAPGGVKSQASSAGS